MSKYKMKAYQQTRNATYWIDLFKRHEYYKNWKANIPSDNLRELFDYEELSWSEFINYSFTWGNTPEGADFWFDLSRNEPDFKKIGLYYV